MTYLLLKLFVPNYKDVTSSKTRDNVGKLANAVGIALNTLLAAVKITLGALFGIVSVLADGINNLTDCGSNVVSIVSLKFAEKPADKQHPYGHRRAEYVASFVVALIVLAVALELAVEGVKSIVDFFGGTVAASPFEWWTIIALSVSVLVKLWMFAFNKILAKRYNFDLLNATALDSIADVGATCCVLAGVLTLRFADFNIDGFISVVVAVIIAVGGARILKETLNHLLGEGADERLAREVTDKIKRFDGVLGVHDLNIHNYGPNLYYASAHVEVDANVPVLDSHEMIDRIERDFDENTNIKLVIHMDPIVTDDPELDAYKADICKIVKELGASFDIHDFRMVKGPTRINLIFDVSVDYDVKLTSTQIIEFIQAEINKLYDSVYVVPTVEKQTR